MAEGGTRRCRWRRSDVNACRLLYDRRRSCGELVTATVRSGLSVSNRIGSWPGSGAVASCVPAERRRPFAPADGTGDGARGPSAADARGVQERQEVFSFLVQAIMISISRERWRPAPYLVFAPVFPPV